MIDEKKEKAKIEALSTAKGVRELGIKSFKELETETIDPPRKLTAFINMTGELTKKTKLRALDGGGDEIKIAGEKVIDITRYEGVVGSEKIPVYLFEEPGIYELRVFPPPYNWDELLFHKFALRDETIYYLTHIVASTFLLEPGWLNFARVLQGASAIPKLSASGELSGSQILYRDAGVGLTIVVIRNILGISFVASTISKISRIRVKNFVWKEENEAEQKALEAIKWLNDEEWDESKKFKKIPFLQST